MKYLKITNTGELDMRIIALMGGTTKADDNYKIGNFGTGLKYTMAYLFRENIDFKIFAGENQTKIDTVTEVIGENEFTIICINGERTSITTQMGLDWKAWMIVREIYSNALDEGDATYEITETIGGVEGRTSIYLEFTPEIMEIYNNWKDYFIVGQIPFFENKKIKLFPQSGNLKVYKQGILIHQEDSESLFNYDILDANINELREYKGQLLLDLPMAIFSIDNPKVIQYFIEHVNEDMYEGDMDYSYSYRSFNNVWKETLEGSKIIHQKAKDDLEARGIEVDSAKNIVVPQQVYKALVKQFDGIGALRTSKAVSEFYEVYNEPLIDRVKQAQTMLENAGYYMEPELTFIYGMFGDKNVMARIDLDEKMVYISERHLDQDMFSICTMLVEENEHFKTGFRDHTREFQQHFINLYTKGIFEDSNISVI